MSTVGRRSLGWRDAYTGGAGEALEEQANLERERREEEGTDPRTLRDEIDDLGAAEAWEEQREKGGRETMNAETEELMAEARAIVDGSTMMLATRAHLMAVLETLRTLADHVLALADDPYLAGHPEWHEIVKDAREARG